MSKFQVGDQVRILLKEDCDDPAKQPVYTSEMQDYEDCIATVRRVDMQGDVTLEVNGLDVWQSWSEDWLKMEGLSIQVDSYLVDNEQWYLTDTTVIVPETLTPQCHSEGETHDIENIMDITRNMCRG